MRLFSMLYHLTTHHSKLDLVIVLLQCQHKQNKPYGGSILERGCVARVWLTCHIETEAADAMVAIQD